MDPLSESEYEALKSSIAEVGILYPIIVDENGVTIDGHHRLRAAKELAIKDVPKSIIAGLTESEKRIEARRINVARRQLTQAQRKKLIKDSLLDAPERSDRQIAVDLGVSPTTVGSVRKEMEKSGQLSKVDGTVGADGITRRKPIVIHSPNERQERMLKNPDVVERMISDGLTSPVYAQRVINLESKAERKSAEIILSQADVRVIQADITGGLPEVADSTIDAIITDAPYAKPFLPLYEHLSKLAGRVLVDGGSLLCMTGQSHLPEVMRLLCSCDKMRYHWTLSYIAPRASPNLQWLRVSPHFKPIIWFVKGKYGGDLVSDIIHIPPDDGFDKVYHTHGQSVAGMRILVEKFSRPGDLVADFFLGAGSVGVASVLAGRRFFGSDINEEHAKTARGRIADVLSSEL